MRILLVEDDHMLAESIGRALTQSAHVVDVSYDGEEADRALATFEYGLVLLDINLPKLDGFELLKRLRGRRNATPVLVMTAREALQDRISGLDLGADDYLAKPFHLSELEARVRALIRRAHATASSILAHGRLHLDMAARRLYCDGRPVDLSVRELSVIELLMLKEGKVVTKQQIVDHLYGWEDASNSNAIEVFVHRLRKKLESSGMDIRTIRGMGYLIEKHAA